MLRYLYKLDKFTQLIKYMEKRFDSVDKHFEIIHKEIGDVAELGGRLRDYHHEMIMLSRKVDRIERVILQTA